MRGLVAEVLPQMVQGWSAEGNLLTGYGGGYQYGPVTTAAPQQPQQQRNTGDELVAELMQATQGVSICPRMGQAALRTCSGACRFHGTHPVLCRFYPKPGDLAMGRLTQG